MKRQRIEIMVQILAFCTRGRRKTRIMYKINLSYVQLKTYLTLLTSQRLLGHNSDLYMITEKGYRFLEVFIQLNDVLEDQAHRAFVEIIKESCKEVKSPYTEVKSHVRRYVRTNRG
ncbi:MAG: winged helix-turn-helix domain-containing protein [Candidatus Bathyarchaeaceae archaeon]